MTLRIRHAVPFLTMMLAAFVMAQAPPSTRVAIDAASRTISTSNFNIAWNTGADTEAITTLNWKGGSNMTDTYELDTCGNEGDGGNVQYFGNAWAPPDPQSGGLLLVGGGTTTPPGTVPWLGQILPAGIAQVTINSISTGCPPTSTGIPVQTTYRFFNPRNSAANSFAVQRVFDFSSTVFAHDLRPYIARLNMNAGYTEVLYPATGGTLAVMNAANCFGGCTGPVSAPGAVPLSPAWAVSQGWFAFHNPGTMQGVVIKRVVSTDPQGAVLIPQLWVDNDGPSGEYYTNASSFLLLPPAGGFTGGLVTEVETLCFYNSTIWTPSLVPPNGCLNLPMTLFPWALTFAGQPVGTASAPKAAILKNAGTAPVTIAGIVASGDFQETDNCSTSLAAGANCTIVVAFKPSAGGIRSGAVTVVDALRNSPQVLSLAGLGVVVPVP